MSDPHQRFEVPAKCERRLRSIFLRSLAEASIAKGFARHVHCERGILRVCEDLYDLHSYSRSSSFRWEKRDTRWSRRCGRRLVDSLEGIVASSVQPQSQVRGFRYFRGGHPTPNEESIQAASAMLRAVESQPASAW